jgi:glucokinase
MKKTSSIFTDQIVLLAGDVGGTKARLGLFSLGEIRPTPLAVRAYPSRDAANIEELIAVFLNEYPAPITNACIAIAGPVRDGQCNATNLPWVVTEAGLGKRFGWERVRLINDLAATILAAPLLDDSELCALNQGRPDPKGNIGVVAPGTGLGMALATVQGDRIHPLPSEGGHADFAPKNEKEIALLAHLLRRFSRVSAERVISGPGLHSIYDWLSSSIGGEEPAALTQKLNSDDPSKVIAETAIAGEDHVCVEALEAFVSILGSTAGNLALTGMTTGGMYLGGGIPPKILPKLREALFMDAFASKGRFTELLMRIPVKVILNDQAALLGAALWAGR